MSNKGIGVIEILLLILVWGGMVILTEKPLKVSATVVLVLFLAKAIAEILSNKLDKEEDEEEGEEEDKEE